MNCDLGLLKFDYNELVTLLAPGVQRGLTAPGEIPEPPDKASSKPCQKGGGLAIVDRPTSFGRSAMPTAAAPDDPWPVR